MTLSIDKVEAMLAKLEDEGEWAYLKLFDNGPRWPRSFREKGPPLPQPKCFLHLDLESRDVQSIHETINAHISRRFNPHGFCHGQMGICAFDGSGQNKLVLYESEKLYLAPKEIVEPMIIDTAERFLMRLASIRPMISGIKHFELGQQSVSAQIVAPSLFLSLMSSLAVHLRIHPEEEDWRPEFVSIGIYDEDNGRFPRLANGLDIYWVYADGSFKRPHKENGEENPRPF
ncbi:MAG: hypothetical protein PHU42_03315 [Patescibacteria group bacterium]|nr:hypothetical protein [Patescibacteria group bacterium]